MHSLRHKLYRVLFPAKDPEEVKQKYGLPQSLNLHVRLDESGWFVVQVPELPGLTTQARSMEDLVEMVNEAVLLYFDVPGRDADIIYNQFQIGDQVVQYSGSLKTQLA
jgi:predicted RNase H-like HicB family nuclease